MSQLYFTIDWRSCDADLVRFSRRVPRKKRGQEMALHNEGNDPRQVTRDLGKEPREFLCGRSSFPWDSVRSRLLSKIQIIGCGTVTLAVDSVKRKTCRFDLDKHLNDVSATPSYSSRQEWSRQYDYFSELEWNKHCPHLHRSLHEPELDTGP